MVMAQQTKEQAAETLERALAFIRDQMIVHLHNDEYTQVASQAVAAEAMEIAIEALLESGAPESVELEVEAEKDPNHMSDSERKMEAEQLINRLASLMHPDCAMDYNIKYCDIRARMVDAIREEAKAGDIKPAVIPFSST
jgi:hypothetical protein